MQPAKRELEEGEQAPPKAPRLEPEAQAAAAAPEREGEEEKPEEQPEEEPPAEDQDLPTAQDEAHLFSLWTAESASLSLDGPSSAPSRFHDALAELHARGFDYDPTQRLFSHYLRRVDRTSSTLFFHYKPLGAGSRPLQEAPPRTHHRYSLQVLHPDTRHANARRTLEAHLIRRFKDVFAEPGPEAVAAVVLRPGALRPPNVAGGVREHVVPAASGAAVNAALAAAAAAPGTQLVAVYLGARDLDDVALDLFVPAYPVWLGARGHEEGPLVFTPLQLAQTNGCDPAATGPAAVRLSLLSRVMETLGAVLVTKDRKGRRREIELPLPRDPDWHLAGLAAERAGRDPLLRDGRVHRIPPPPLALARAAPVTHHGWLSKDTQAALSAALRVVQPTALLELGSWYGLSTMHIKREAPHCHVYAADYFKNNAIYKWPMEELQPIDKLFFHFLRFETFHRNLEPLAGPGGVTMLRMDASQAVRAVGAAAAPVQVVFIDCEKKTQPLRALLRLVHEAFPQALIVGDDYVFKSVKDAVRGLGRRLIALDEAYLLLPNSAPALARRDELEAAARAARAALSETPGERQLADMVRHGDVDAAARLAAEHGLGVTVPLFHTTGKTLLHEACFQAGREVFGEGKHGRGPVPREDQRIVPQIQRNSSWLEDPVPPLLNHACLTPYDYLTHALEFV